MNRISIVIKERVNTILDNYQDPREVLDHSYVKQTEMLDYGTIFMPFMNRLDAHSIQIWWI